MSHAGQAQSSGGGQNCQGRLDFTIFIDKLTLFMNYVSSRTAARCLSPDCRVTRPPDPWASSIRDGGDALEGVTKQ